MNKEQRISFFLGANSAHGFFSLYDSLADPAEGDYTWYIKGGPGSGKSTFMRCVAEAAEKRGYHVAYVRCSGDPSSLDGIYIHEQKTAYVDATSPHIQEPAFPGAAGRYLDLSDFYKKNIPFEADRIADLFTEYRKQYARAYELLQAAALCAPSGIPGAVTNKTKKEIQNMVLALTEEYPMRQAKDRQKDIFLSAITGIGRIRCLETIGTVGRILKIKSAFGLENVFLEAAAKSFREKQYLNVLCHDPLLPERLEALIVPEADICYIRWPRKEKDVVNLDVALDPLFLRSAEEERKSCAAQHNRLLRLAERSLHKAGVLHSELESVYKPTVDFAAVSAFTQRHIAECMI